MKKRCIHLLALVCLLFLGLAPAVEVQAHTHLWGDLVKVRGYERYIRGHGLVADSYTCGLYADNNQPYDCTASQETYETVQYYTWVQICSGCNKVKYRYGSAPSDWERLPQYESHKWETIGRSVRGDCSTGKVYHVFHQKCSHPYCSAAQDIDIPDQGVGVQEGVHSPVKNTLKETSRSGVCNSEGGMIIRYTGTCQVCGKTDATFEYTYTEHELKTSSLRASTKEDGFQHAVCTHCNQVIYYRPIAGPKSIELSASSYAYTGNAITPKVTVLDNQGNPIDSSYYEVTYSNNKKVGVAAIVVNFNISDENVYIGKLSKSFKIIPRKVTVKSLTVGSQKLTVTASAKVSTTGGTEYQIGYKRKDLSKWKYVSTKNQSRTIKDLKKGKYYEVKIRAFKTINTKKYYAEWSKIKVSKKIP